MFRRFAWLAVCALLAASTLSCAVSGGGPGQAPGAAVDSRPAPAAARMGLPPPYRVFYDELADYGDWTLIEPYGWVFRPHVNFVAWRPYQEGWWEPSDVYGWVWNSTEPFGWITYHYGDWFYDRFQGWVWQPGGQWGPSWVAWVAVGNMVGWAPLGPSSYDGFGDVPGGPFTYVPASALVESQVGVQANFVHDIGAVQGDSREVFNLGRANGAIFNKGPDPLLLKDLGAPMLGAHTVGELPRVKLTSDPHAQSEQDLAARSHRLAGEAARELGALRGSGAGHGALPPPALARAPRYKPGTPAPLPKPLARPVADSSGHKSAPADSTRHKHKGARSDNRGERFKAAAPDSTQH